MVYTCLSKCPLALRWVHCLRRGLRELELEATGLTVGCHVQATLFCATGCCYSGARKTLRR